MGAMNIDIAIVGGGMVGMTLACALAENTNLSIGILESRQTDYTFDQDSYHHRVSAIALSSKRIFQSLNVWQAISDARVSPFTAINVWDAANQAKINFECNEIAEPILGYIIENDVVQFALRERLKAMSQVSFIAPVTLTSCLQQDDGVYLHADDGRAYFAKLAVAADGANSWLRQQVGIAVSHKQYEQHALVATVQTELAHEKSANQVFLPTGPLAFLPLQPSKTSSIVWSLPPEEAARLTSIDDNLFHQELAQAFDHRLGAVTHSGPRFTFPLRRQQASAYVRDKVVLVGDAAHVMHPLAGQGVNVGLLDAASLAQVLAEGLAAGKEVSTARGLRRYERWRRADNLALLTGIDLIKHLFASGQPGIQTARGIGLSLTNKATALKNIFARYATGGRDDLPMLAKPAHFG